MHAEPTRIKAVPWNAVEMRKTKNAARFGASAVPILLAQKRTAVIWLICYRCYERQRKEFMARIYQQKGVLSYTPPPIYFRHGPPDDG